jgi:hypothetical protein
MKFIIQKSGESYYADCHINTAVLRFSHGNLLQLVGTKGLGNAHCGAFFYGNQQSLILAIRDYFPNEPIEEFKLTFAQLKPGQKFTFSSNLCIQYIKLKGALPNWNACDLTDGSKMQFKDDDEVGLA